jgi:OOP family OmpA-OmpF porin
MKTNIGKLKREILLTGAALLELTTAMGQLSYSGYFNQGDKLFIKKDYYAAAQYFQKYLELDNSPAPKAAAFTVGKKVKGTSGATDTHQEAIYRVAECELLLHDYAQAERWYKEACKFPAMDYPLAQYGYGVSLRANGKYEEAMTAFTKFQESYTKMDTYLTGADQEIKNLRFIQAEWKRTDRDSFVLKQQQISGFNASYAASIFDGDTIAFTGISPDQGTGRQEQAANINRVYISLPTENSLPAPESMDTHAQTDAQDGMATFSEDGRRMFFTRWNAGAGKRNAAIFESKRTDSGWSQPVKLTNDVNKEGFNSAQPFISESVEGRYLLFSSDRPGGLGNYDLWFAEMDSAYQVLYVKNMGGTINSPGDEQSPFFHKNSRILVFSSNGRPGMGGYDIYYSKGNISLSNWERPANPGMAINSSKDDLYFISTDDENLWNTGWLSSDRASDCCLALFSFRESNSQYVAGTIVDCRDAKPLEGAAITLVERHHPGKQVAKMNTDQSGRYHFDLHNISAYRIMVEKKGYIPVSAEYTIHFTTGKDSVLNGDICLSVEPDTNLIREAHRIQALLNESRILGGFAYKKSTFTDGACSTLDSLVALMHKYPSITVRIDGYTDGIGGEAYNLKLAAARVDASIDYLVKKGIGGDRLKGRAMGKCCPLVPETVNGQDDPAAREKNRRVEYTILTI